MVPPSTLQGFVDGYDDGTLFGWAARAGDPGPVTLDIRRDGRSLGTAVASLYREDLKAAGIGAGPPRLRIPRP